MRALIEIWVCKTELEVAYLIFIYLCNTHNKTKQKKKVSSI